MKKQLEKWYVWDGKTEIYGAKQCIFENVAISLGAGRIISPSIPALVKSVSCYTLGETVPSKRKCVICRKTGCDTCP